MYGRETRGGEGEVHVETSSSKAVSCAAGETSESMGGGERKTKGGERDALVLVVDVDGGGSSSEARRSTCLQLSAAVLMLVVRDESLLPEANGCSYDLSFCQLLIVSPVGHDDGDTVGRVHERSGRAYDEYMLVPGAPSAGDSLVSGGEDELSPAVEKATLAPLIWMCRIKMASRVEILTLSDACMFSAVAPLLG